MHSSLKKFRSFVTELNHLVWGTSAMLLIVLQRSGRYVSVRALSLVWLRSGLFVGSLRWCTREIRERKGEKGRKMKEESLVSIVFLLRGWLCHWDCGGAQRAGIARPTFCAFLNGPDLQNPNEEKSQRRGSLLVSPGFLRDPHIRSIRLASRGDRTKKTVCPMFPGFLLYVDMVKLDFVNCSPCFVQYGNIVIIW